MRVLIGTNVPVAYSDDGRDFNNNHNYSIVLTTMASAREERMQQRLRGAQRRQVKDVDFGLTFPAGPDNSQASQEAGLSQSTPGASLPPGRRPQPDSRRGTALGTISPENNPRTTRSTANDANISAKRRKLNSDQAQSSPSTHATRSSLRTRSLQHSSIEGRARQDEREMPVQMPSPETSPMPTPIAEIVMESPAHAPGSGHRVPLGLNEASAQSARLQDSLYRKPVAGAAHATSSPAQKRKRRMGNATPKTSAKGPPRNQDAQEDDSEVDELSPDQPRRQSRNPRQLASNNSRGVDANGEDVAEHSEEEAEEIDDAEAAAVLRRGRGRGRPSLPRAPSPDLDEPTPVAPPKKRGRPSKVSTPAQQRQPKPAAAAKSKPASHGSRPQKATTNSKSSKSSQTSTKASKVRSGSPIPIVVHRFTKRQLYDEDESDADILNSEIPYIKRGGVNAIDVLSQVCHEIIESGLDTLAEGGMNANDSSLRREYKTKWTAVEAFGRELQNRLLDHAINLDNTYALEKRVREERKRRLALREDILRVRAEREQVALRMDRIRIKHEAESKGAQERDSLNNTIHDIELALERGKQQHPNDSVKESTDATGLELVLKRVAGDVSNKSDSGGILKQVKEFNAFLERAALALETKRA